MTPPLTTKVQSCGCKRQEKQRKRQRMSFLLTLLVAILPKCPFCAFGYSSVVVMCSGAKIHNYQANVLGFLSIPLAFAVLISLCWNYRGKKNGLSGGHCYFGDHTLGICPTHFGQLLAIFPGNRLDPFGSFAQWSLVPSVLQIANKYNNLINS